MRRYESVVRSQRSRAYVALAVLTAGLFFASRSWVGALAAENAPDSGEPHKLQLYLSSKDPSLGIVRLR